MIAVHVFLVRFVVVEVMMYWTSSLKRHVSYVRIISPGYTIIVEQTVPNRL